MINQIVVATGNAGKLREFQTLLAPFQCIAQNDLGISSVAETGLTFLENALIKARHVCKMSQRPALADDSGLVIPSLNGEPGIYSARFSGPNATDQTNIDYLLDKLQTTENLARSAYFYCALVFLRHERDPSPLIGLGTLHGEIIEAPRGQHGFGYDPIFYLASYKKTLAELSLREKNTISHRFIALQQIQQQLKDYARVD